MAILSVDKMTAPAVANAAKTAASQGSALAVKGLAIPEVGNVYASFAGSHDSLGSSRYK